MMCMEVAIRGRRVDVCHMHLQNQLFSSSSSSRRLHKVIHGWRDADSNHSQFPAPGKVRPVSPGSSEIQQKQVLEGCLGGRLMAGLPGR